MKKYEEFKIRISREDLSEQSKEFRNQLFEVMEKLVDGKYEKGTIGEDEIEITYSPNKSNKGILAQYEGQEVTEEELDNKLKELGVSKEDLMDCTKIK